MKQFFIFLPILFFVPSIAFAAGSATTLTYTDEKIRVVEWSWTSDAAGTVSGEGAVTITGIILGILFEPDDTDTPTNLYDVQLLDDGSADILHAVGANQPSDDSDTGKMRCPINADGQLVILYEKQITPSITNAGNAKSGIIYLFLK